MGTRHMDFGSPADRLFVLIGAVLEDETWPEVADCVERTYIEDGFRVIELKDGSKLRLRLEIAAPVN